LCVGQSTIAFHKQNIMRVLGLASGEALLQYAVIVRTSGPTAARQ
jgi:DNA-binding NarL/FixJ family response regulator